MADFNISDRGVQNSLTRMELDIKKAQQETQTWQTDVAKAEIMATHLMSTQSTLADIVTQVQSGKISVTDAQDTLSTMWPALGTVPGMHNYTAELGYFQQAVNAVDKLAKERAIQNAKWTGFTQGFANVYSRGNTYGSSGGGTGGYSVGGYVPDYNLDSWTPGITVK